MACTNVCAKVINDIAYSCDVKPIGGIEQVVKLINRCDINIDEWTVERSLTNLACTHKITEYSTGAETDPADLNAVTVEGIPGKRLLNAGFSSSNNEFGNYYTHFVNLFAQGLTENTLCTIKALGEGAEVVAIIEQKNKGANGESAFVVYGWDQGLKLGDMTFDHNENNGSAVIPVTSLDPDLEGYPPMILDFGTYTLTKSFFDSL